MQNIKVLCLLICFAFFSVADTKGKPHENTKIKARNNFEKSISASKTYLNVKPIATKKFPNIFRPIGNFVKRLFGRRIPSCILRNTIPVINNVNLSRNEIQLKCAFDTGQIGSCANNSQSIEISTDATDAENDPLVYIYKVSGGEIIGYGSNVIWSLANVPPGIYTIEICADDGMGCIKPLVKEVRVVECPDCDPPRPPPIL